jgi:hypothetical protein
MQTTSYLPASTRPRQPRYANLHTALAIVILGHFAAALVGLSGLAA